MIQLVILVGEPISSEIIEYHYLKLTNYLKADAINQSIIDHE